QGTTITVRAEGPQADAAVAALTDLVSRDFDEYPVAGKAPRNRGGSWPGGCARLAMGGVPGPRVRNGPDRRDRDQSLTDCDQGRQGSPGHKSNRATGARCCGRGWDSAGPGAHAR